ncbi:unnamed protein product [Echinostoma caproni]|uniref:SAE2 domain-containing protein n=1 Tax=Echinostoma caproni TaxID=27848 RepID=A0A183A1J3_9TREM|nr:unnamed protein product [Echinostoma caproni]
MRIHRCSRHRTLHGPPPSTPKGFWDLDISDDEPHNPTEEEEKKLIVGHNRSTRRRLAQLSKSSGTSTASSV